MLAAIHHQESRWTKTRNTLKETCESWWQLKTNTGRAKEQQDTNDCSYREISEDGIIVLYEETVIEWARDPVFVNGELQENCGFWKNVFDREGISTCTADVDSARPLAWNSDTLRLVYLLKKAVEFQQWWDLLLRNVIRWSSSLTITIIIMISLSHT